MDNYLIISVKYTIYRPSGNDTALVNGINYSKNDKKIINDYILNKHKNVEQVGFIDKANHILNMAGGEFCGNAARCATYDFLNGNVGNIDIKINDNIIVKSGINDNNKIWCEIPLADNENVVKKIDENIYIVDLVDIIHIVILKNESAKYLSNINDIKKITKTLINKYNLQTNKAVGVIYLEEINNLIKINPVVWVNDIDTCFYETACGSGSMAVCLTYSYINKKNINMDILQPSSLTISAQVEYDGNRFINPIISGEIEIISKEQCDII